MKGVSLEHPKANTVERKAYTGTMTKQPGVFATDAGEGNVRKKDPKTANSTRRFATTGDTRKGKREKSTITRVQKIHSVIWGIGCGESFGKKECADETAPSQWAIFAGRKRWREHWWGDEHMCDLGVERWLIPLGRWSKTG